MEGMEWLVSAASMAFGEIQMGFRYIIGIQFFAHDVVLVVLRCE